ncbi:hypothetical protein [Granulicella sibirica]|uniref:Uncharacterized protein n=1 Tax=Granulicella sibirica TaxID=2479048 RepID=A0A4Q0TB21_9BACT|nr:hypothetical protein [Granulicella sibirica]RXH58841.1 hypothetical protein GRAN_2151 [Granulicella sibirica]
MMRPENPTPAPARTFARLLLWTFLLAACLTAPVIAQSHTAVPSDETRPPHRTRLILKDGSYQIVMSYKVQGDVVRFVSAERSGDTEEIPTALVDLDATRKYEQAHTPPDPNAPQQDKRPPALDPELIKEEADRASRTPEVAPDLRLDTEDAVLLLDTFHGAPELVPLVQSGGDLNKSTAHSFVKGIVNPLASSHQIVQIKGTRAPVQSHVAEPVLYLRLGDEVGAPTGSAPMVVDTSGSHADATSVPTGGSPDSRYVILRADVRQDVRVLASFKISALGTVHRQEDVVETKTEILPGGHWMKLTPTQPLDFGEFALMEVVSEKEVNLGVWDFGVHPTAPDNRDALHPEPRRPASLERHPRDKE